MHSLNLGTQAFSLPPARAPQRMLMRTHMSTYLGTEPITAPSHAVALLNRQSMFQRNEAGKVDCKAQLGLDPMSLWDLASGHGTELAGLCWPLGPPV